MKFNANQIKHCCVIIVRWVGITDLRSPQIFESNLVWIQESCNENESWPMRKSVSMTVRLFFFPVQGLSGGITPVTPLVEGDGTDKAGTC